MLNTFFCTGGYQPQQNSTNTTADSCSSDGDCKSKIYGDVTCSYGRCTCDNGLLPINNACGSDYTPGTGTGSGTSRNGGSTSNLGKSCHSSEEQV